MFYFNYLKYKELKNKLSNYDYSRLPVKSMANYRDIKLLIQLRKQLEAEIIINK